MRGSRRLRASCLALNVLCVGPAACQGGGHDTASDGSTGGFDATEEPLHDDGTEFEVEDPGATPPEVVDTEKLVIERLEDRRDDLDARALALAKRNKRLEQLESEIDTRLGNIEHLEKRLQTQLGIGKVAHERRDERIAALSELVATMTPQAGADLVAKLGDRDAQWILMSIARKNQRKAAKLMAAMPSDRAAQLGQLYLDTDPKSVPRGDGLGPVSADADPPSSPSTDAPAVPPSVSDPSEEAAAPAAARPEPAASDLDPAVEEATTP